MLMGESVFNYFNLGKKVANLSSPIGTYWNHWILYEVVNLNPYNILPCNLNGHKQQCVQLQLILQVPEQLFLTMHLNDFLQTADCEAWYSLGFLQQTYPQDQLGWCLLDTSDCPYKWSKEPEAVIKIYIY